MALENVNKQLTCRTQLDMGDIKIAVGRLKELNASRYKKLEAGMITDLASCIKQIGRNFPERAEEALQEFHILKKQNETTHELLQEFLEKS